MKYWYAILMDEEDNDWGVGSYDFEEAMKKALDMNAYGVAVIDEGSDPICTGIEYCEQYKICSDCGALIQEGYVTDNWDESFIYCEDCQWKHYTHEEWEQLYDFNDDAYYYTQWY